MGTPSLEIQKASVRSLLLGGARSPPSCGQYQRAPPLLSSEKSATSSLLLVVSSAGAGLPAPAAACSRFGAWFSRRSEA